MARLQIRKPVRKQVNLDLTKYFNEAEEHEDLEVLENTPVGERIKDFYRYQVEKGDGQ